MRVTFVSYDDEPPLGGQGVVLRGMRRALTARGVDVETIAGHGASAIDFPNVTGRAPLDLSLFLNRHPEVITRGAPDVVHVQGGPGGVLLLRRLGVPLVYTAHHTYRQAYLPSDPRRVLSPLEGAAYRRAARVLAVSESTAHAVIAMRVPATRVEVVAPGIDLPDIDPSSHETGRMLFVGRLEREKGALAAVALMRRVVERRPGWRGVIIGSGHQANAVRSEAAGSDQIAVLGRAEDATVSRELARASVVLMPSQYEGLGLVALEAQARETPVVGYDVTGLRDAVRDGGILVEEDDEEALFLACMRVLEDDALRALLGRRGREFVAREHSWETVGRRLQQAYAAARV
ncbi:MAG: glycosyltransferase family 4 protein [Candidatus Dormibacteria bacterium]